MRQLGYGRAANPTETDDKSLVLDFSKQTLKKVPKKDDCQNIKELILDDNELQKIDNIDSYLRIEKLSLCKNQLLRMYGVCRLHLLKELHLAYNGILTIEGLKELIHLTHLNLEGNNIKSIEHLNTNVKLEYLNLSDNSIGNISDISFLKCLKDLRLNGNRLTHLRQCDKYLPISLEQVTIAKNLIPDLNEICTLVNLCNLHSLSVADNPCVQMTGSVVGFDHRPFVLNWCMSLKVIDGYAVNAIESLKAEWLYSQGRGRQFRVGEQIPLVRYLSSTCPMSGETLESENDRKLRLILSKAQQHQRQLQEEISDNTTTTNPSPASIRRKGNTTRIQSPRFSRLGRQGSPDSMSSSYHGNTSSCSILSAQNDTASNNSSLQMSTSLMDNVRENNIMSKSLDPTLLSSNGTSKLGLNHTEVTKAPLPITGNNMTTTQINEQLATQQRQNSPLAAATKMVPVPESLMSPDCPPPNVARIPSATNSASVKVPKSKIEGKPNHSPKVARSSLSRRPDKSPVTHARKNNINSVIRANTHSIDSSIPTTICTVNNIVVNNNTSPDSTAYAISSDDDSDNINVDKLKIIRNKAAQRCLEQKEHIDAVNTYVAGGNKRTETCAIMIQKIWRGYSTRKRNEHLASILQKKRTQEYIIKLSNDMETTKVALENERKIQQLQMQAINALWKKVSTMQTTSANTSGDLSNNSLCNDNNSTAVVQDLAKTCSVLTNQVQQLQGSMRDIINCITVFCNLPQDIRKTFPTSNGPEYKDSNGTQTEIVAVHTPQVDNPPFPFNNRLLRPSTLPLDPTETSPKSMDRTTITEENIECTLPDSDRMDYPINLKSLQNMELNENCKELIISNEKN